MHTGIEQIAHERNEQLSLRGFSVKRDAELYKKGELRQAAMFCLTDNMVFYPQAMGRCFAEKVDTKSCRMTDVEFKIEMLKMAGAFCAAEIDRLQYQ